MLLQKQLEAGALSQGNKSKADLSMCIVQDNGQLSHPFHAVANSLTFRQTTALAGGNGIGVDEGNAVAAEDCKIPAHALARA